MTGFDPFLGYDPTEYDANKTYTRSTNKHDHSITVNVNMPREYQSIIGTFVKDDAYPGYTSVQAFIRDAIFHRVFYLAQHGDDVSAMQDLLSVAAREKLEDKIEIRKAELKFTEEQIAGLGVLEREGTVAEVIERCYDLCEILELGRLCPEAQRRLTNAVEASENWAARYSDR